MPTEFHTPRVSGIWRATSPRVYRAALAATACAAIAVTVIVGITAGGWVGKSFPGFFVLPNRIIPSVSRDAWSGSNDSTIYQRTVVAVDDKPISGNVDAYHAVAAQPPGTGVRYTLRHGSSTETLTLTSRTFSRSDYWIIFGSYLLTGLLYLWLGVLAAWLLPDANLGRALLLMGGVGGIFALTGAGIYEPGADLRIHALAESFFPATLVYAGLVFAGTDKRWTLPIASIAWWLSLAIAIIYQLVLGQPGAYTLVHSACEAYMGAAGLGVGATLIVTRARAAEQAGPLLRASVAGALLGIGVPAVIMMLSGMSGGALPVNIVTATAFLFPLCIGYGLVRERVATQRVLATSPA
jgi:hypothetical protein